MLARNTSAFIGKSFLFRCWNSQINAKVNRCYFHYLEKGLSLSHFLPPFLLIVVAFWEDCCHFQGHVMPVPSTPWKASLIYSLTSSNRELSVMGTSNADIIWRYYFRKLKKDGTVSCKGCCPTLSPPTSLRKNFWFSHLFNLFSLLGNSCLFHSWCICATVEVQIRCPYWSSTWPSYQSKGYVLSWSTAVWRFQVTL